MTASLAGQGLYEAASDVHGWMERMLSGATDALPPMPPPAPEAETESHWGSSHLPPPDPPMMFYPALVDPDEDWPDEAFPPRPGAYAGAEPAGIAAIEPKTTVLGAFDALGLITTELVGDEEALQELDAPAAETPAPAPAPTARLEVLDGFGEWVDGGVIPVEGRVLGRGDVPADVPGAETLAAEHVALWYEGDTVVADDLGSVDGVYRRINEAMPLEEGQRFRVSGHVLEFRRVEEPAPVDPLTTDDRGVLCTRDLVALAFVNLIRPNGRPGLRFPLTKRDATVIGREGPTACIALTGDAAVSASHAQVRVRDGAFFLEDLKSRGGTFLQIQGPTPLNAGDVLQAGKLAFRIAGAYSGPRPAGTADTVA